MSNDRGPLSGSGITGGGSSSRHPLHRATKTGDLKEVKHSLKALAKKQGTKTSRVVDTKDDNDQTALHVACFEGHLDIVKFLVDQQKANVNARDKNNWTPLHGAASGLSQSHIRICAFLLDRQADAEARTNDGSSPLHYFVRVDPEDNLDHFRKVLERMIDPEGSISKEKYSQGKDINQRVKKIVNAQNMHGESALHHAAIKGREHSAIYLHHLGADVNLTNKYNETSLIAAIRSARPQMAKLLLSLDSDPSIKSDAGSALELAESNGLDEIVCLLKGGNSHPRKKNNKFNSSDSGDEGREGGFGMIVGSDTSDDDTEDDDIDQDDARAISVKTSNDGIEIPGDSSLTSPPVKTGEQGGIPTVTFHCGACGTVHTAVALNYHAPYPALWGELTPSQRAESKLSLDLCKISISIGDGDTKMRHKSWFIRGLIEIPIIDNKEAGNLTWGVWVAVSKSDFFRYIKKWQKEGREKENPYNALLQTSLPSYKNDTKGLKVRVHTRPVSKRPWLDVLDSTHELYTQQKEGITMKRLIEILDVIKHY